MKTEPVSSRAGSQRALLGVVLCLAVACQSDSAYEKARRLATPATLAQVRAGASAPGTYVVEGYLVHAYVCRCPAGVPCAECPRDFVIIGPRPRESLAYTCDRLHCPGPGELVAYLDQTLEPRPEPTARCRFVLQAGAAADQVGTRGEDEAWPRLVAWACPGA